MKLIKTKIILNKIDIRVSKRLKEYFDILLSNYIQYKRNFNAPQISVSAF